MNLLGLAQRLLASAGVWRWSVANCARAGAKERRAPERPAGVVVFGCWQLWLQLVQLLQ